jgi:glycosyltransferase involved in cell wall biosynthesis
MRVYEIITPSRIGGAETQVAALARALADAGDDVRVFCPAGRPFADYLAAQGISPVSWATHGKFDPVTLFRHAAYIKAQGVDVVHAHLSTGAFLGSLAAHLAGRPCVATVHGFTSVGWYRGADRLIAVSSAIRDHLVRGGIPADKVVVITNGIDLARYTVQAVAEAKAALGVPAAPRVGAVGRLSLEKGQDVLLRAWPAVLHAYPHARLVLVGDGKMAAPWRALADELGIAASVEWTGFLADPRVQMAACDAIAVPSRKEGLGLAAVEALALGRPVAASGVGGLCEVVTPDTGLLVPPDDPAALAEAITRLLATPVTGGRACADAHFSLARQVAELRALFASLLPRVPAPPTLR